MWTKFECISDGKNIKNVKFQLKYTKLVITYMYVCICIY